MVASTSSANTARTTGRAMGAEPLVERPVARMVRMRVQLIDPSADVLPYDHALAGGARAARTGRGARDLALRARPAPGARRLRAERVLLPARPRAWGAGARGCGARSSSPSTCPTRCACAPEPPAPTSCTGSGSGSRPLSARLLPRGRPSVLTMHNVIRRGRSGRRLAERMDAMIVHTRHGAELLGGGPRVHVIPHGAFEHLTRQPDERPLPPELAAVRRAGGALLRRRAPVQGRRRAGGGIPLPRRGRAVGGGAAARRDRCPRLRQRSASCPAT